MNKKLDFVEGLRDGFPIGAGYFAVSFSLGIMGSKAGMSPFQGFLASLLTFAGSGEFAGFQVIASAAPYFEMALVMLVINARYLLMSCVMSQRFSSTTSLAHKIIVGFGITDEIFAISISRRGFLSPYYNYGAILSSLPFWAGGTAIGILAGNILPLRVVSALGVCLYGMFLATIIPPCKKSKIIAGLVLISFALSFAFSKIPFPFNFSDGSKIIVLTIAISAVAALVWPIKETTA